MTPKHKCEQAANDVIGGRCGFCDPVIESRTYGGPEDYFSLIVETTVDVPGQRTRIERVITPKPTRSASR